MNEFHGVRIARRDEADAIYDLLLELHSENGMFTLNEAKSRQTIHDLLDPQRGIIGVIDGPDGLEGTIGLFLTAWWYTNDGHLSEFWNFVRQDKRRTTHAKRLIQFGKWCAERLAVPLHMGIVTTDRAEAKQRLYRRQLTQVGGYFMYGATPRLTDEITKIAEQDMHLDEVTEEMAGAVKRFVAVTESPVKGRPSKRRKAEIDSAVDGLKRINAKAGAAINGRA